jgi:hypothetical protein
MAEFGNPAQTIIFDTGYSKKHLTDRRIRIQELLDTQLRPYESNDFFEMRMANQSRILNSTPEICELIDEVLTTNNTDLLYAAADLIEEARQRTLPPNHHTFNEILSFIKLEDYMCRASIDKNTPKSQLDGLRWFCRQRMVQSIPDEYIDNYLCASIYFKHRLRDVTIHATQRGELKSAHTYDAVNMMVDAFATDLRGRLLSINYANMMPGQDEQTPDTAQIEADTASVAAAFSDLRSSQSYGLKLGYMPHELGGNLIYGPVSSDEDIHKAVHDGNAHKQRIKQYAIAEIVHSTKQSLKHIKPEVISSSVTIGYQYDHLDPAAIMFIDSRGELFADSHCVFSLRDIFVRQQKYGVYRKLQAKIIADYFDMTRPALVVERINRTITQQHSDINQSGTEQEPMDVFRRLVIPRVRAEQVQQATPPIEQDEAIKTPEDVDQTARSIRFHGVVWHRRRLPEGWSASPQAQELALAAGVVLRENETFVREHRRGTQQLGEVAGHAVVKRSQS